jgi:ribose 5-phosphate isomerase A
MQPEAAPADRQTRFKQQAAEAAADLVVSGSVVGLGTGSTALWVVRALAQRLDQGRLSGILAVPTSRATEARARRLGIPLTHLAAHPVVDITIDGADEIDPRLNVIKGAGGALLREKIVAHASRRWIIVADETKLSEALGRHRAVPVEVVQFGWQVQREFLTQLGAEVKRRMAGDGSPFVTDQGNYILDCRFGPLEDAADLAVRIKARSGIVEHGLFLAMTDLLIVAGPRGVRCISAGGGPSGRSS